MATCNLLHNSIFRFSYSSKIIFPIYLVFYLSETPALHLLTIATVNINFTHVKIAHNNFLTFHNNNLILICVDNNVFIKLLLHFSASNSAKEKIIKIIFHWFSFLLFHYLYLTCCTPNSSHECQIFTNECTETRMTRFIGNRNLSQLVEALARSGFDKLYL